VKFLPESSELAALVRWLQDCLSENQRSIHRLAGLWLTVIGVSKFYISISRPDPESPHTLYPIWRVHERKAKDGTPWPDPLGRRMTRSIARAFDQGTHWNRNRELFDVFNAWMERMAHERHLLIKIREKLRWLFCLRESTTPELLATLQGYELALSELRALARGQKLALIKDHEQAKKRAWHLKREKKPCPTPNPIPADPRPEARP
jgi:hypothetical protein